jgi:hypothetical protein
MRTKLNKHEAKQELENNKVYIRTSMGSCQCGDTSGTLTRQNNGELRLVNDQSSYDWQNYTGLARECQIGYGFGATARELASLVEENKDVKVPYSFSSTFLYKEE